MMTWLGAKAAGRQLLIHSLLTKKDLYRAYWQKAWAAA
jgi:hypothetical protein